MESTENTGRSAAVFIFSLLSLFSGWAFIRDVKAYIEANTADVFVRKGEELRDGGIHARHGYISIHICARSQIIRT